LPRLLFYAIIDKGKKFYKIGPRPYASSPCRSPCSGSSTTPPGITGMDYADWQGKNFTLKSLNRFFDVKKVVGVEFIE
jgi:hypothetical protein